MELFQNAPGGYEPLAARMRPRHLGEYVGQEHILGPGRLLKRAIEADRLSSLIFSGPPGTGKTTLARVIAASTKSAFLSLNAVLSGVKEIRELIEKAQEIRQLQGKKTILFVDEVHRWNKSQQDALLPWVENGTFILIGATTENPYFEVNSALVSRSRVFQLQPLDDNDLLKVARQAIEDKQRGYGGFSITWEAGALEHLVNVSSGDARSLLNALELAVETSISPFPPAEGTNIFISLATAEDSIQRKAVLYDKDGDYHFDTISAFIKSLRGSDPDAALYWLARMVRAGEDPHFIFRRMLISASEDVGLADPQALVIVEAASSSFQKVGMPEGQFHLAQAALYLATCPKSNTTMGYFEALKALDQEPRFDVPSHLKDANRDQKAFGHGQGYLYPHAYRDHWVSQQYLPSGMGAKVYYQPTEQGYEGTLRSQILRRRELLLSVSAMEPSEEVLTYTEDGENTWMRRLGVKRGGIADLVREKIFEQAEIVRHHRVWIANDIRGFLLLEALRKAPEGRVWCNTSQAEFEILREYLAFLPELNQPDLQVGPPFLVDKGVEQELAGAGFDRILAWCSADTQVPFERMSNLISSSGKILVLVAEPSLGQRLSNLLPAEILTEEEFLELQNCETAFLESKKTAQKPEAGFKVEEWIFEEEREIVPEDWQRWWTPGRENSWPNFLIERLPRWESLLERLRKARPKDLVTWKKGWTCFVRQ